jgi:hypothetical protein
MYIVTEFEIDCLCTNELRRWLYISINTYYVKYRSESKRVSITFVSVMEAM